MNTLEPMDATHAVLSRIGALESASRALAVSPCEETCSSIRRLAVSISRAAGRAQLHELSSEAAHLSTIENAQLSPTLDRFLSIAEQAQRALAPAQDTVLIVEDDPGTATILSAILAARHRRAIVAVSAEEARARLRKSRVTLIILDLQLTNEDGRDFLEQLRSDELTHDIPVIVTTVKGSAVTKMECFALGADAYFQKPIDFETLAAVVSSRLTQRKEQRERVLRDPLTGLLNRRGLEDAFEDARSSKGLVLAVIDVDEFKSINDSGGHGLGDEVLVSLSRTLRASVRETDAVARWGGDEFVILFRSATEEQCVGSVQRALEAVRRLEWVRGSALSGRKVTFSAGVSAVADNESLHLAMSRADRLLYDAKTAGRNRVSRKARLESDPRPSIALILRDSELCERLLSAKLGSHQTFEALRIEDLEALGHPAHSVTVLELESSRESNLSIIRRARSASSTSCGAILGLVPRGADVEDVGFLDLGLDDFVLSPWSPAEIVFRVLRLERRVGPLRLRAFAT